MGMACYHACAAEKYAVVAVFLGADPGDGDEERLAAASNPALATTSPSWRPYRLPALRLLGHLGLAADPPLAVYPKLRKNHVAASQL
jgi:hypothetical protein